MSPIRTLWFAALFLSFGCVRSAPQTATNALQSSGCAGTHAGNGCLTLHFVANDEVRENAPRPLRGRLSWGIYRAGDVGLFGPGDHEALRGTDFLDVDLEPEGASFDTTLPDVAERSLQVLAYLDTNGVDDADSGDAVTFPSDAFAVPPDEHTIVTVVFDFIR